MLDEKSDGRKLIFIAVDLVEVNYATIKLTKIQYLVCAFLYFVVHVRSTIGQYISFLIIPFFILV